jgi:hypothetical protein
LLHALAPTGDKLARWQGTERFDVCQNCCGLVKTANKILAARQIHPGFTPDRRIYLRQQAGGNLNKRKTAQVNCSSKSSNVADNATTQSDHAVASFDPEFREETKYLLNRFNRLMTLAVAY